MLTQNPQNKQLTTDNCVLSVVSYESARGKYVEKYKKRAKSKMGIN